MSTKTYRQAEPAWVETLTAGAGAVETLPTGVRVFEWPSLADGDVGAWLPAGDYAGKSVSVDGTFGGSTVTWQGTDEPTPANAHTLHDPSGAALAMTASGKLQVLEDVLWIRPSVAGGAAESLTARVILTTVARR